MKYQLLYLFLPLCFSVNAQHLEEYQWKHRILLIISENDTSDLVKLQLESLDDPAPLAERQLIIYRLHPKTYKIVGTKETDWIMGSALYHKYNPEGQDFKLVLIGLDGSVKLGT